MKQKIMGLKHFFYYTLIFFLIIITVALSVIYVLEEQVRASKFEEIKNHERQTIDLELNLLGNELGFIIGDLSYLSLAFRHDLDDENEKERLIENWLQFSYQRGIYDQIRFINIQGDEEISINLGNKGSYLTAPEKLKNISENYFFEKTTSLDEGSIYISRLDLRYENGIVEVPYKPLIRFCTPIYDSEENLIGIVVLNYLAEHLLMSFKELADSSYGEMVLLNSNGDWLSSNLASREWNFMFEGRETLTFEWYFDEWLDILQGPGQIVTENGLFTFKAIDLSSKIKSSIAQPDKDIEMGDGNWHIVSYILREEETGSVFIDRFIPLVKDIIKKNIILFIVIFLISFICGYLFYLYIKAYRKTKNYSRFDSLTKVYNRRAGTEKLESILTHNDRRKFEISLCFIDVNGLKYVNDLLGHKKGDELIVTVSHIIQTAIRGEDFVARMGGDEFIVLFYGIDTELAEIVWSRIVKKFEYVNENENRPYKISISHGIVSHNNDMIATSPEQLIKAADSLMYEEKRRKKVGREIVRAKKKV